MGEKPPPHPNKRRTGLMTMDIQRTLSLFSSMYLCQPTKEVIEKWKPLLAEGVPCFLLGLKTAIQKINLDSQKELEELLWEYTKLFIGPYKLPCPPWESVYTSPGRLLMQEAYDQIENLHDELGLALNHPDLMPDHLGVELNFFAVLYEKSAENPGKKTYYMEVAQTFLNEHLRQWVPQFTLDMEKATDSSFYKALARATRDFLMSEIALSVPSPLS